MTQGAAHLVQSIKSKSASVSGHAQRRHLLQSARSVAEATSNLGKLSQQAALNPVDHRAQQALSQAGDELRTAWKSALELMEEVDLTAPS